MSNDNKNEYAKHVSLFLAELLRTRKITLHRAADIAQKVLDNLNLIDTEQQFLEFVKVLTREFEQMHHLEDRVHLHIHISKRKDLERKVRSFVIHIMPADIKLAIEILEEALQEEVTLDELETKFPIFKQFIESNIHSWTKNQP